MLVEGVKLSLSFKDVQTFAARLLDSKIAADSVAKL